MDTKHEKIQKSLIQSLLELESINADLYEALNTARPLVEKWTHTQGNSEALREKYLAPIDVALIKADAAKTRGERDE